MKMNTIRRNQSKVTTWLALIIRRRVRGGGAARGLVGVLIAGMVAFASVSEAAIGIDNVSTGTGNGSSITVSHTTAGTNRLMLVGISGWTFLGTPVVSGVTYNSVALSLVGSQGSASFKMWIYGLVAPDTGTHDVVVSFSTAPNNGGVVGVETFTGVNQSTPLGTFGSASGNGTTATVDVSSAPGELVFDTLGSRWTVTAGAGQTQRWNASSSFTTGSGSTEPGATTVTMSWGISQTDDWAIGAVPIKPAPTGAKIATLNHNAGEFAVGYPHQRKVLRDASGYWYMAYMDYNGSTSKYEIYLTKSTNTAGTSWSTPVKIAGENGIVYNESTYDFRYPAIDIDRANGRLHIVFNKAITVGSGLDDHLVYSRCTNLSNWNLAASWTQISGGTSPRYDAIQTTVYVAADPIYAPSIALNSSGNVHIGYITPPGSTYLVYHVYGTTSWGSPVQVSSSSYLMAYPTVEVRSNDWVYFAWSLTSSSGGLRRVNHSYSEAAPYDTWAAVTYIILQNYDGIDLRYVSMAADDEGNIQLACEQHGTYSPGSSIWGAYFNGASWTMFGLTQPIDTFGWDKPAVGVTLGTGVTTDIIIAARDGTDPDAVYRWKWNGSAWALPAASTLETTDSFVALEKRAPSGATFMGFVTFDAGASTGDLYFSRVRFSDTQTQFTVAANSDDATEGYNTTGPVEGYMWLNGAYDRNRATTDPTLIRDDGVRFANVTVPAGATVTGAWFEAYFYDDNTGDGLPPLNDDIDCTVYAHDTDNSSTFTTTTFNITDTGQRPRTSAGVPWQKDGLAGDYAGAAAWAGLHVLEPVQEVASRSGWASGNAITLLFIRNPSPSATKSAIWRSRDNGSNYPKLTITYTTLGVEIQEHASGQIADQLLGDATQSNVNLFRFQITNDRTSETTISQIQFQLSGISGIYTGDLSNIRIHDGTSNVATGGTASISGTTGTITFTNWVLPAGPATRNYTLIADLSSLQPDETLTVALGTSNITLEGSLPVSGTAPSNATHTVDYPILLAEHASGQITDQFDSGSDKNDVTLFRFKLTNTTTSAVAVDQVQFQLSSVTGIVGSDFSDLRIAPEGGGTVGGTASVWIASGAGTITFADNFNVAALATVNYELIGDVANLVTGDTITLSLGTGNVTLTSGTTSGTAPTSVTHTWNMPKSSSNADDSYDYESRDNATTNLSAITLRTRTNAMASGRDHTGLRFPGVYVPAGVTISSATIYVYVESGGTQPRLNVYGNKVTNPPDFSASGDTHIWTVANRPRTTANTAWTSDTSAGWRTINVKSIVEEIIAQPGWQSGNAMGFLFIAQTNAVPYTFIIRSYDNTDHSYAPYLDIIFTPLTTLAVGNHASGQVTDAFDGNLSHNDKELFRFRLTNTTGADATVDQIVFPLSSVSGISSGDLGDLKIKEGVTEIVTGGVASIASGAGTITFTADWVVPAGQTKDYSLYGDISNLQYGDTLTIALGGANITVSGDASGSVSVSAVHTADYAVTLANYGTGQLTDQLDGTPTQNDKNLFRFRLVNTTVSDLTISQVVIQLSSVTGIADTHLSDLRINNGTIDVTTGGVASIAAGSGTITFDTDFTLPASATVDYTVIGDVANIVKNDTMTIALGTANLTLAAGIVGGSAPTNVTHTGDDAATLGNHGSGQLTDQFDSAPAKDNVSLFRFQLVNTTAVDLTIDQVQFQLSAITGIVTSNLSDLRINNGTSDVATGGSPNISGATGTITFTGDFTLPASATVNYTLIGDAIYLAVNDTMTIALGTSNITMLAGSVGGTAPTNATHTTNWPQASASGDDAYVIHSADDTTSYLASTQVQVHYDSTPANRRHGGFRIPGVYIPQGATINSATLNVYVGDTYDDPPLDVYGHLTPNAPNFSTNTQIYARPRTTATVAWTADNIGFGWKTVNVTGILQELVNQATWENGNAAAFLFIARTNFISGGYWCNFHAWDYDSNHTEAAYLNFTFTPTVVNLASFSATGNGKQVRVDWETSSEIDNLGFNLYRSMEESGGYTKLNKRLIPGLISSPTGRSYTYVDDDTIEGKIYYYRLEDIDLSGKPTLHGPVTPVLDKTLMFPEQSAFPPLSVGGITQAGRQRTSSRTTAPSIQRVTTPSPIGLQWDLAGSFAIKMSVTERGWYRVTQAELVAAGLDPKVNPRFLRLFVDGKEQPIRVKGQSDGRFGKNDFIEFYGEGIDTLSTDTRVYWLVVGETRSKRISNVSSQRNRQEHPSIPFTVEIKERSLYFSALLNGEEDNFFGPVIWNDPVERAFDVRHLDPAYTGNAILTVRLQGVTLKPHQVQVLLNSVSVGEVVFDGQAHKQVSINVSQSVLLEGENHITLVPQGGDLDMTLLDTVRLTYQRTFMAEADELGFILSSPGHITIDGFSSRPIRVADVTDPEAVKLVSGTSVSENPPGYSVRFGSNPRNGSRTFYAFSEAGIKRPVEIKANRASTWHHEGQGADLVIISPSDFMDSLAPLKTLRESQGFSVALIDVEDLYDEFSYGTKTPQAIKDFLTRANTSWQTPPRFVLLAGGASFDPRNYLDFGNMDFLPTKLLDTAYMETASDDWFVDFNGDGLPDIAVGRLPVQTAEEATQVVSKLIAYDHAAAGGWATEVLMVADQNDTFDFEGTSQEVSALIPGQMTVWSVYRGQAGDAAARTAILGSINEGKLIVNYIGHGAVDLWKASVLTASDPPSLLNGSALPFVVGMTCLNGFFQSPYVESLAEALLKAENGGAVGIWTSSGLTVPNEQSLMNKELMRLLLNGQGLTLGEATARAKAATQDMDVRRSWILFGDPTTKLK